VTKILQLYITTYYKFGILMDLLILMSLM